MNVMNVKWYQIIKLSTNIAITLGAFCPIFKTVNCTMESSVISLINKIRNKASNFRRTNRAAFALLFCS